MINVSHHEFIERLSELLQAFGHAGVGSAATTGVSSNKMSKAHPGRALIAPFVSLTDAQMEAMHAG